MRHSLDTVEEILTTAPLTWDFRSLPARGRRHNRRAEGPAQVLDEEIDHRPVPHLTLSFSLKYVVVGHLGQEIGTS